MEYFHGPESGETSQTLHIQEFCPTPIGTGFLANLGIGIFKTTKGMFYKFGMPLT